jgi:hypothetical protein
MNSQILPKIEELLFHEPEFIDVDMPFNAKEVENATGKRYVEQLTRSDMVIVAAKLFLTAEQKKSRGTVATEYVFDPIDVDMPFSAAEVSALTSQAYVAALGPSDMPIVGRWGQFAPSVRKDRVVHEETIAVNSIRKAFARKEFSLEDSSNCTDALA